MMLKELEPEFENAPEIMYESRDKIKQSQLRKSQIRLKSVTEYDMESSQTHHRASKVSKKIGQRQNYAIQEANDLSEDSDH